MKPIVPKPGPEPLSRDAKRFFGDEPIVADGGPPKMPAHAFGLPRDPAEGLYAVFAACGLSQNHADRIASAIGSWFAAGGVFMVELSLWRDVPRDSRSYGRVGEIGIMFGKHLAVSNSGPWVVSGGSGVAGTLLLSAKAGEEMLSARDISRAKLAGEELVAIGMKPPLFQTQTNEYFIKSFGHVWSLEWGTSNRSLAPYNVLSLETPRSFIDSGKGRITWKFPDPPIVS